MGRIVAAEYVTLDGVMESPMWTGPYFDDDVAGFQDEVFQAARALLLGRVTYEGFKAAWPQMEASEGATAVRMNSMPKHVATTTLTTPEWNATFLAGDVVAAVTELKQQDGDLLVYGSAALSETLRAAGLIDEYRLMIAPVVVGHGRRLFTADVETGFEPVAVRTGGKGMLLVTLRPR